MLYEAASLKQSCFFFVALEYLTLSSSGLYAAEVRHQLLHLSCTIEDVCTFVIVEEQ